MNLSVKLPKTYYAFANLNAEEQSKNDKQRLAVSLSSYQACILDKHCYNNNSMTLQELFKNIILNHKILDADEINLRKTERKKFDFLKDGKFDCKHFANTGTSKQYLIYISSYAKTKIIQFLIKNQVDLTWFLKKELVKNKIFEIEDLSK